jgi:hypothetical protein
LAFGVRGKILGMDRGALLFRLGLLGLICGIQVFATTPLQPDAKTDAQASESVDSKADTTPTSGMSSLAIGGWVGVAIFATILLLVIATIFIRGRNKKGLPTTVRGEVVKVTGLANDVDPYVVVSSLGEMAHRTEFQFHPGENAVFEEPFTWSVSPKEMEKFKSTGKVRFEVFNMKGADYSAADATLGAVEIPVSELFTEGQVERVEALRLRTKKGVVINVKVGIFAEHFFFQSMNRFNQYWRLRRTEISFWARVLSIGFVFYALFAGLRYFDEVSHWALGVTDIVVGCVIGFNILPHMLYWVGIHILDRIKVDSLFAMMSLFFSSGSAMVSVWRFLGPSNGSEAVDHLVLTGFAFLLGVLFLVGELRNEPGTSCLGSLFSSLCGCCFGGSRGALLRAAI